MASNGADPVRTKLAEEGLPNGVWAVDMTNNRGKHSVTLPSSLALGGYLLRADITVDHECKTNYLCSWRLV